MEMKQWIRNLIDCEQKSALPILSFPSVQMLGITVLDLLRDSENQARGMAAIAAKFPTAASVSLMDLSVEAEAFGAEIRFCDNEVPSVVGRVIHSPQEAEQLAIPAVGEGRTGICAEAMRRAVQKITDRPVLSGIIGPFSLAGRLMDMTEIMVNCYEAPEMVVTILQKCTAFLIGYAKQLKAAGAHGIVMAEPAAGLLSPQLNANFSLPYVKEMIDAVRDDSFAVIYHNCGNTVPLATDIFTLGADGYHFGNAIKLSQIIDQAPQEALVLGNVDPVGQFRQGTPESIAQATTSLLQELGRWKNFVISSGCDIPPLTPLENISAFFDAVEKCNQEKRQKDE